MESRRQEKVGIVTSNKMQKSVVVTVDRQTTHPLYKRVVRRSIKFLAHDEKNECKVGDTVRILETRPLSRRKRWRVVQVIAKAAQVAPLPEGVV
ncbi:MAG TPA: 30S ribosomal protein S17 [Terriglobia bacterium]|nr:30S ribosomal protein S17 [Terriglobia bacterium]